MTGQSHRRHDWDIGGNVRVCMLCQVLDNLLMADPGLLGLGHALAGDGADEGVRKDDVTSHEHA